MLAAAVLVLVPLLHSKCPVLCMSSIVVRRLLVGMLCVRLHSMVGHGLLLVSSMLMFLVLLLACSSPSLILQEVCCCSCPPVQVHNGLLCWWCCVQGRTLCFRPSVFLLVEVRGVAGLLQRSCWLLSLLREEVGHPRRPRCMRCAAACSRCWVLLLTAVNQAVVVRLLGVFAMLLVNFSNRRLLCWASKRFRLLCCRTLLVDTCGDRPLLLLRVGMLPKCPCSYCPVVVQTQCQE